MNKNPLLTALMLATAIGAVGCASQSSPSDCAMSARYEVGEGTWEISRAEASDGKPEGPVALVSVARIGNTNEWRETWLVEGSLTDFPVTESLAWSVFDQYTSDDVDCRRQHLCGLKHKLAEPLRLYDVTAFVSSSYPPECPESK